MPQSLGSLFVELKADTAGFVSALSKAAYTAQKASRDMSREFRDLGSVASQTFGAFGDFNPIISKLSFALQSAGSAASSTMKEFGKLGGALGPLAALGAGAATGLASLGIGVLALAAHSAEAAAKMEEMSQSTGLSAETLTRFGFVAKQVHIEPDVMALALQRMSRSAFQAATALPGTSTAYSKLGVSVRDSARQLKSSESLMLDLADRFSRRPDGIPKTALAMQIFGRAGAEMIPLLGEGRAGIDALMAEADRLGVTLSGTTLESAYQFSLKMGEIRAAADGAANTLMVQLLPALNAIPGAMAEGAEKNSSSFRDFLVGIAAISKGILAVGDTLFAFMADAGATIGTDLAYWADAFVGFASVAKKALVFDFAGASAAYEDEIGRLTAIDKEGADSRAKIWGDNAKFIQTVFGELKPPAGTKPGPGGALAQGQTGAGAPEASHRADVVAELVGRLQQQAAAELELAAATEKSTSSALLAKAAAEAETKIGETRAQLLAQEKDLREQLADAKRLEAGGNAGAGARALTLEAEIGGIQRFLAELQKDTPQIKQFYAEIAGGGFAAKASKELDDFTGKTDRQTEALRQMAAAYTQGPAAVQRAQEAAKIAPFEETRSDLGETIAGLRKIGAPAADIAKLQTAYDQLTSAIDRAKVSVAAFTSAEIAEKIDKEKLSLTSEAEAYRLVAAAALSSAKAQREAAARAEAIKFGVANPGANLDEVYETALAKLDNQRKETIAQEAAQYDLNASYAQELEKLKEIKAFLESSGESTLAIDTKIYEARVSNLLDYRAQVFDAQNAELLGNQKIFDASRQQTEQWDRAALTVGSLGEKFRAMVNEIELSGAGLGEKVFGTLKKGVDDVSSSLAKFIVTGKSGFASLLNSMAEELVKAQLQWTFAKIFQGLSGPPKTGGGPQLAGPGGTPGIVPGPLGLGGALAGVFGLGGKSGTGAPTGSPGSPFYVIISDSTGNPFGVGNALPISPDKGGGSGGLFGAWSSGKGDTSGGKGSAAGGTNPLGGIGSELSKVFDGLGGSLSKMMSSLIGSLSGIMKGIGGLFGGFLAGGGDASTGRAYVVGEKGPEIFMPAQAGRVIPSLRGFRAGGGSVLANSSYMVGENGPEIFMPNSGPAASSSRGGGGGDTYHLHVHGVQDADSFNKSKGQIFADLQQQMALAHYRNRGGF